MGGGFEDRTSPSLLDGGRPEGNEDALDDLATLADSYLLADPGLASEFAAVDDALEESMAKMPGVEEGGRGHSLDAFQWHQHQHDFRTPAAHNWEDRDVRQHVQKGRAETGDSNEWEHTRDHRGNLLNTNKSESPNSGHLSATSTPLQTVRPSIQDMRTRGMMEPRNRPESPFVPRVQGKDMGHLAYEAEKQHLPQSFSRLLQHPRPEGSDAPNEAFDRSSAGVPPFSSPACPPSVFSNHPQPAHLHRSPDLWPSDLQESPSWMQMRDSRARPPPFCNPETLGDFMHLTAQDRWHSAGHLTDKLLPEHLLRGRAALSAEDMDLLAPKMEYSPRMKASAKHVMPHIAPLYSPQQPSTPSEAFSAERKRKRPTDGHFPPPSAVGQALQDGPKNGQAVTPISHMSSSSSQTAQDDLIRMLKAQIEGIDSGTKAILKDTLYRISRNTNQESASANPPRARQSNRTQYLDKLVANFLYNRFEYTDARPGSSPYGSEYPAGYAGRGFRVSSLESIKPLPP